MNEWTIPDLIDFEYFLATEGTSADVSNTQRDRRIFREAVEPRIGTVSPSSSISKRSALRIWLEERKVLLRAECPQAVLPGEIFSESRALLRIIIAIVGLVAGAAVAFSLLTYTGKAAVNVSLYLGVLVFLQIVTLLVMVRYFFLKPSLGALRRHSLLYGCLSRALERIAARATRAAMARIEGQDQDELRAMSGIMRGMYNIYGRVLFWPFFAVVQLFGVMFNVGAIGATLIRVFTSDLAFGWQSTVQMSSLAVYSIVRILAAPWSWLFGPHAYPSLEQIEGSRMVLKEGLTTLATGNLVSWWPFLVGAVLCYGLLPRVLLAVIAVFGENQALARVRFTHAGCDALLLRMRSPEISTQGVSESPVVSTRPAIESDSRQAAAFLAYIDAVALVPEDIIDRCVQSEIDRHLGEHLGWKLVRILPITGSMERDHTVIETALQGQAEDERAAVFVQEAWLPPIVETIELIREVRGCGGKAMPIAVLLIGKPAAGTILTPVRPIDKAIWEKTLAGLADPYLTITAAGAV